MKRIIIWLVVAAQLAVLLYMAGQREWISRHGQIIWLRTAPVDPQDVMRGEYARLSYDISNVPKELCRDGVLKFFNTTGYGNHRDKPVYALLMIIPGGIANVVALTDLSPKDGLFLRGRVSLVTDKAIQVRYGIEAFFLEQGKAKQLEDDRRGIYEGTPLDAEVAVAKNGLSVLKDTRWEPLGLTIKLDRKDTSVDHPNGTTRLQLIKGVTVTLKNHSAAPVALVIRSHHRSFRLIETNTFEVQEARWIGENQSPSKPVASDIKVLPPGEEYNDYIDLTTPDWFVTRPRKLQKDGEISPVPLEALADEWGNLFRIEYSPAVEPSDPLARTEGLSLLPVSSRSFSPTGNVD